MTGLKPKWLELINLLDIKGFGDPSYFVYKLQEIYQILEDVYSVGSMEELQEAIDSIGAGAGTIFIEAGTHEITVPIDVDGGGSLVIYGHGDNTILQPDDGINVFNITDCASLIIKTLQIDATNYTGATSSVIVNETNDNVISLEDVTIIGNNLGTGIELISDNCLIEHCNISQMNDAILLNNSNRNIIAQNILSTNARYGIYLDTVLYSNIGNNTCNSNLMGIYVNNSTNNSISNNICNQNNENGIYITNSSYNTISGNTCENNDSNTVNDQAGMFITNNSDFNTISGNSLNNNNNIGAGTGYGIIIAIATCEENVVASNNANGNDVDFMDSGTATTIEYYVQDYFELQEAINSIGTKAGIINLEGSFTVSATIIIDGNGSYIIRGAGSNTTLTTVGDISCFNITSARSVILRNFRIDASSLTTATREIIDITEVADNPVIIEYITIIGDSNNGVGVEVNSDNCRVSNCNIQTIGEGIYILTSSYNTITGNTCSNNLNNGIYLNDTSTYNTITGNICNDNGAGINIRLSSSNAITGNICNDNNYGMYIVNNSPLNAITGNTCSNNTNNGIYINNSTYNTITGNTCNSNDNNGIIIILASNNLISSNICENNDSNTANPQAGIYIWDNCDQNIISANICNNNNNIGAGITYGIYIVDATCNRNIVIANNCSGNDINWLDIGTNSDFEYRCSTEQEIQDAIDSIATKSGTITILTGTITLTSTIDVNGGGDYIIEGEGVGTVVDCAGDRTAFNITSAKSCILRNFKIDSADITTINKAIISINEGSNNKIIVENVNIIGDADKKGVGIYIYTDNIEIISCIFEYLNYGIFISIAYDHIITRNRVENCNIGIATSQSYRTIISLNICISTLNSGIKLVDSEECTIIGNHCDTSTYGIMIDSASHYNNIIGNNCILNTYGIRCHGNSTHNFIQGNYLNSNTTGIYLTAGSNDNRIGVNNYRNNGTNINNLATRTDIFGDDTAYAVSWNEDLGTPTKNAVYDEIEKVKSKITIYNTGWINRTDWTNVHMGSSVVVDADSNVAHNLGANLSELLVRVFISTDGTDANSFEPHVSYTTGFIATTYGYTIYQVDVNNIKVQTGVDGLLKIEDNGTITVIAGQDWHYKIVVYKLS